MIITVVSSSLLAGQIFFDMFRPLYAIFTFYSKRNEVFSYFAPLLLCCGFCFPCSCVVRVCCGGHSWHLCFCLLLLWAIWWVFVLTFPCHAALWCGVGGRFPLRKLHLVVAQLMAKRPVCCGTRSYDTASQNPTTEPSFKTVQYNLYFHTIFL